MLFSCKGIIKMIGTLGMRYYFRLAPEIGKERTNYYKLTWCGKETEDFILE